MEGQVEMTGPEYDWDNADEADYAQVERIAAMSRVLYRLGQTTIWVDLETFDLDRDQAAQLERSFEDELGPDGVRKVDEELAERAAVVAEMRESLTPDRPQSLVGRSGVSVRGPSR